MRKVFVLLLIMLILPAAMAEVRVYAGFPKALNEITNAITIADINNDNQPEIIVAPNLRSVYVYSSSGNLLWKAAAGDETPAITISPFVVDLDGNGQKEIVLAGGSIGTSSYTHRLYIWSSSGTLIKSYNLGNGYAPSTPAFADGLILVGLSGSYTGMYAYDMNNLKWQLPLTGGPDRMNTIATGDLEGDGKSEAIVAGGSKVTAVNLSSSSGSVRWQKDLPEAISPVIINSNGKKLVVASGTPGTFAWDAGGTEIWKSTVSAKYYYNIHSSPAVADLNSDGYEDLIIPSGSSIYALSGKDGTILFTSSTTTWPPGSFIARPAIYDINGDSKPEIILGDSNGYLYIWDNKGALLSGFPARITDRVKSTHSSPAVSDLIGDGIPEIAIGSSTHLHVISVKANNIPPKAVITSPGEGEVYQLTDAIQFTSGSYDTDGAIVSTKWYVNGTLLCESISCTKSLPAGIHNIVLEVTDDRGASGSADLSIRVNHPPFAVIDSPSDSSIFKQKDTVTFAGTGTDEDGSIASYQWISEKDGILSNERAFTSSSLSTGVHNITFAVADNNGASSSKTIQITQTGYEVAFTLKQYYKPGNMIPIKFRVTENGMSVVDPSVVVNVQDPNGNEVFRAVYGNGSKDVRINNGEYITNFESDPNSASGQSRIDVRFDSQKKNQEFSETFIFLNQKSTYFTGHSVNLKTNTQGQGSTYEWKLDGTVIGTGTELSWLPESPGIYNIQLYITKNKKTDIENYTISVNAEADANGDGLINVLDLSLVGLNWGKRAEDSNFDDRADINGDGVIDILDAVRIGKKWS